MKHRVIIIDDEQWAIDVINHHLSLFDKYEVIETFRDPTSAMDYIRGNSVELVFSDIAMPKITGLELVKILGSKVKFIITTSYAEHAVESFDLSVVDYLLKPISLERFQRAIERYEETMAKQSEVPENYFFVKDGDEYIKIIISEIEYIEGQKDYAKIVLSKGHILVLKTLKSLSERLSQHGFLRIHKSYIINASKILQFNSKSALLKDHQLPVGSSYREVVKAYMEKSKL